MSFRPSAVVPELVENAEHVRPLQRLAVLQARQRVDEAHHPLAVEGANQHAAAERAHRQYRHRDDVVVSRAPDLALQLDDLRELGQRRQIAISEISHTTQFHVRRMALR